MGTRHLSKMWLGTAFACQASAGPLKTWISSLDMQRDLNSIADPLAQYSSSAEWKEVEATLGLDERIPDEEFKAFLADVTNGDLELEKRLLAAIHDDFKDYCAHPPEFQHRMMPEPLSQDILNATHLELVGVQLVFRHGARDLASNQQCFSPMNESFTNCHLASMVIFNKLGGRQKPLPLVKQVMNAYPNASNDRIWTENVGCGRGELLDEALPMTFAFGDALQANYFDRLPRRPTFKDMRLYATDEQRTLGTLYYILKQFLPEGMQKGGTLFPLFTRPLAIDPWDRNVPCPRAVAYRASMGFKDPTLVETWFPKFAQRWKTVAGTAFQANFKDCLNVAACSHQQGLKLPAGLQPGSTFFQEALRVSLVVFHRNYLQDVRVQQLLVAPVLIELEDYVWQQVRGGWPLVSFWSSHDDTMMSILVALGIWDGVWPPYTDSMVLEVYRSKDDKTQAYFRWLRGGKPLSLPWCGGSGRGPAGLCKVSHFLPEEIRVLRDNKVYNQACTMLDATEAALEFLSPRACFFLGLAICFSSCMGGYFLHGAIGRWRRRSRPECAMTEALLGVA